MHNASLKILAVVLVLMLPAAVHAELKIYSIRINDVIKSSPQYKQSAAQFNGEFEKRRQGLEAEAKKFADDVSAFKKEADVMSPEARTKSEYELQTRRIELEKKQRALVEDSQKRERELGEKMLGSIKQVVLQVAQEKGADLVVQDPIIAAPGVDLTDEVLQRLQGSGTTAPPLKN